MKIYLNVYDLANANYYLHSMGLGIYHSGIQIGSQEYHFGGHDNASTGVCQTEPREYSSELIFRDSIFIGECNLSYSQVNSIIDELKTEFPGNSYDVLARNCNHFSNQASKRLLNKSIPSYVNRMASLGNFLRCCIPSSVIQGGPASDPTRQSSQNGSVKAKNTTSNTYQFTAFKGAGVSIGGNTHSQTKHTRIPNDNNNSSSKPFGQYIQQEDIEN